MKKSLFFIFLFISFFSNLASAVEKNNILDSELLSRAETVVNQNPKWVDKARRIVTPDSYGRCKLLSLDVAIRQEMGRFYDNDAIPAYILLGEILKQVRPHLIKNGISSKELDSKLLETKNYNYDKYKSECVAILEKIVN